MRKMRAVAVALLMLSLCPVALPQSFTGVVSGRVLDPQQSIIPQASLTLRNPQTGVERSTVTDERGNFQFISVPPGRYELMATRDGFIQAIVPIEVNVAGDVRADITLKVGNISEQITVTAPGSGAIGETISLNVCCGGEQSNVVTREQVVGLPTLTRNVYELVSLSAGASPTSESAGGLVGSRAGAGVGLAVNGQRSSGGNYVLDGGENNNTFDAGPAQNIPLDSVKEFRVITNNYTAEYGRNAGFIANIVSSVGTNDIHGSLFNFNRNSVFSANSFDANANGLERPHFNRNQFGGTVGGPVIKDKVFFFGAVEPIRVRSTAERKFYVPTTDYLKSPLVSDQTKAIFVNNLFNASELNPSTTDVIKGAYGAVITSGPEDVGAGLPQNTILASGRIDYNINSRLQLFGRYSLDDEDIFAPQTQPYSRDLDQGFIARSQNILLNLTRIWSNRLVTESRVVYGRTLNLFPGTKEFFPVFFINTGDPFGDVTLPSGQNPEGGVQNLYQFYQTASLVKGNHLFKFGGQYLHTRDNRIPPVLGGQFGFGSLPLVVFGSDESLAEGRMDLYSFTFDPQGVKPGENISTSQINPGSPKRHYRYNEFAFFLQDSWKVTRRLTLSPGIRWEYMGVLHSSGHERDLDSNFYYGTGPDTLRRFASGDFFRTSEAPGKYRGHFYLPDYNNFAPRFGLAYDIFGDGSTLLRSGIGVFYDRTFGNQTSNVALNPPSYVSQAFSGFDFDEDFLRGDRYKPLRDNVDTFTLGFVPSRHLDQNLRTAYTVSWNVGVERLFTRSLMAGATYIGASGVKLYSLSNTNRVSSRCLLLTGQAQEDCRNDGNLDTLLDIPIDGVPFPRVLELNTRSNQGHSSYHGLQLKVETGNIASLGLQFWANYTWSHSIDNISSVFSVDTVANPIGFGFLDPFNPDLDRGDSDFDARQRFSTNFVWNIPFGRKSENWFVKNVAAGWGISGILSFQTGQPFSIYDSSNPEYLVNFTENPRAILSGSVPNGTLVPDPQRFNTYLILPLDTGAFSPSISVSGQFDGTSPRNIFRRPGTQYHNMAIMRDFGLPKIFGREGARLQLRAEFYNVFNHSNLYVIEGSNDIGVASFTGSGGRAPAVTVRRGTRGVVGSNTAGLPSFIDNRQMVLALKFIF